MSEKSIPSDLLKFQEFIEDREIRPEDFDTLRALSQLPRKIFLENHNSFSGSIKFEQGAVGKEFRRLAGRNSDESVQRYYELMAQIADEYDGTTAWNLNSILERPARD